MESKMDKDINFRMGILDFQIGECHDAVTFEADKYIEASAGAHIQDMIFMSKDAYGNAYYNSSLVAKNRLIRSDYLQRAIETGKGCQVGIYAYYNVLLDDKIATRYPQYRMIDSEGNPVIAYDYYKILCPNSPYLTIVKDRIGDLVTHYDIKGLFLDITYFQQDTCFCTYCKDQFFNTYGYKLSDKLAAGTTAMRDWYAFRRQSRHHLISSILERIKSIKDIAVFWNGSGSYQLSEIEIDAHAHYLTTEFHSPNYLDGIIRAKWMRSRNKPFTMSTPYELRDWGDWTVNPETTMHAVMSTIISNGGGVSVNHVPYPSGEFAANLNPYVQNMIKKSYQAIEQLEPWLKHARSAANIAVIHSIDTKRLLEWSADISQLSSYYDCLAGITKILLTGNRTFDLIGEDSFQENQGSWQVVLLPDLACLQERTLAALRTFAKAGGTVIATHHTSLFDSEGIRQDNFQLADLFGVDYQGQSPYSVDYIYDLEPGISAGIPDVPILIKKPGARTLQVKINGTAQSAASLVEPLFEATLQQHVYHQHAHPARRSGCPAIVINPYGLGHSLYFATSIFTSYQRTGSPWLRKIVLNCLDKLFPHPAISVSAPTSVSVSLMRQDSCYILHLVNVNDEKYDVAPSFMEQMIPVQDIRVKTRLDEKSAFTVPDKQPLRLTRTEQGLEFAVPTLNIHQAIVLVANGTILADNREV